MIEDGFRVITNQHLTDSGHLDILGIDSEGTLVVIELKNEAAEGHLAQGLRYYDWCRQNIAWIAQAYRNKFEISRKFPPRLLLKRKFFVAKVLSPGGNWIGRKRISSRKEWNTIFENHIQPYLSYLDDER